MAWKLLSRTKRGICLFLLCVLCALCVEKLALLSCGYPCLFSNLRIIHSPAFPHCSPQSLPATLPSPPSARVPDFLLLRSALASRLPREIPVRGRSPLPSLRYSPRSSSSHPPAPIPRRSPALPAPTPQTPSGSATPPNRSAQTASKTLSTSCTKSAVQSLPSVPPW